MQKRDFDLERGYLYLNLVQSKSQDFLKQMANTTSLLDTGHYTYSILKTRGVVPDYQTIPAEEKTDLCEAAADLLNPENISPQRVERLAHVLHLLSVLSGQQESPVNRQAQTFIQLFSKQTI